MHDYDVKFSYAAFYGARKHTTTNLSFSFKTWVRSPVTQFNPRKFTFIWHFSKVTWSNSDKVWNKVKSVNSFRYRSAVVVVSFAAVFRLVTSRNPPPHKGRRGGGVLRDVTSLKTAAKETTVVVAMKGPYYAVFPGRQLHNRVSSENGYDRTAR